MALFNIDLCPLLTYKSRGVIIHISLWQEQIDDGVSGFFSLHNVRILDPFHSINDFLFTSWNAIRNFPSSTVRFL